MIVKFNSNKLLKEKQRNVFLDNNRFKVIAAGRRFGKSYLSTYFIMSKAIQKKEIIFLFRQHFNNQGRSYGIF